VDEIVSRYRLNYGIPQGVSLSRADIDRHLALERDLTAELLASTPETRWETFERCYARLYAELPWLNEGDAARPLGDWPALLGPAPQRLYEVGSGQGGLARELVAAGYDVEATEVTRERGGTREEGPSLRWSQTDGVHLDRFAAAAPYDAVLSDQLVEHLHPDDLVPHFQGAHAVLRPGGRYVLRTPHAFLGPADISLVFGLDRPVGMHLREYTYGELATALRTAGFTRVSAPFGLPARLRRGRLGVRPSPVYQRYLAAIERLLARVPHRRRRRLLDTVLRAPLFRRDLWIVAERD
jgi:SAM-dependent methyltransferase